MGTLSIDRIGKLFASRRAAAGTSRPGRGHALIADKPIGPATARQATPAAGSLEIAEAAQEFLFVQSFEQGLLEANGSSATAAATPPTGTGPQYTLTLTRGLGQTLFFSDRPERIVGTVETPLFLDRLGFDPGNPPNAALVAEREDGTEDVLVIELTNPRYDESSLTATYDVGILQDDERVDMTFVRETLDDVPATASYGASHLFIDDCPDIDYCCKTSDGTRAGYLTVGTCWSWSKVACLLCEDYADACDNAFPDQCQSACHLDTCP